MNIEIKKISPAYAKDTWKFRDNPRLWQYTKCDTPLPATLESERQCYLFRSQSKSNRMYAILYNGMMVGAVTLKQIGFGTAAIGYYNLRTDLWGKGITKEAVRLVMKVGFEELKLDLLYIWVNSNNVASWKLARCLGFYSVGLSFTDTNVHRFEMTRTVYNSMRVINKPTEGGEE